MKKVIIIYVILVGFVIILTTTIILLISSQIEKQHNYYYQYIGDTIVIKKDTLFITDYSILNNVYILSNNQKFNSDLVIKLINIKKIKKNEKRQSKKE